jgi:hypothetical protein
MWFLYLGIEFRSGTYVCIWVCGFVSGYWVSIWEVLFIWVCCCVSGYLASICARTVQFCIWVLSFHPGYVVFLPGSAVSFLGIKCYTQFFKYQQSCFAPNYVQNFTTRGRCFDHNFLRFSTIFCEKIGVFLKTNVMIKILDNLPLFWVKNANFFAEFFAKIFKKS